MDYSVDLQDIESEIKAAIFGALRFPIKRKLAYDMSIDVLSHVTSHNSSCIILRLHKKVYNLDTLSSSKLIKVLNIKYLINNENLVIIEIAYTLKGG